MSVPLLHESWVAGVEKFVALGTICCLAADRYNQSEPVNPSTSLRAGPGSAFETCPERSRRISIKDLVEMIARLTGFDGTLRVVWDTSKPNARSVPRRKLDTSRAERGFGFEARTPFEVGLRRMINWYMVSRDRGQVQGVLDRALTEG